MTRVLARAVILALTFSGAAGIGCSSDAQHFVAVRLRRLPKMDRLCSAELTHQTAG